MWFTLALRGIFATVPRSVIFGAVGLVAGAAALWGVHHHGYSQGRQATALEAAQSQVSAYKDRNHENATVDATDALDLCIQLDGLPDDCRAGLRRVGADHPQASVGGLPDEQ